MKEKFIKYYEYLKYFEKVYVYGILKNWHFYNSFPNVPLTNNVIEVVNACIKREITNFVRLDMITLLNAFFEYFKRRKIENLQMRMKVVIPEKTLLKAKDIIEKDLIVKRKGVYFLDYKLEKKLNACECDKFLNINENNSLEEIEEIYTNILYLKVNGNKEIICSCIFGFKNGYCYHSEALKIKLGYRKNILHFIPNRIKSGKAKKVKQALERRNDNDDIEV
jgi:hypothetical protein